MLWGCEEGGRVALAKKYFRRTGAMKEMERKTKNKVEKLV